MSRKCQLSLTVLLYHLGSLFLIDFLSRRSVHRCEWAVKVSYYYYIPMHFSFYICWYSFMYLSGSVLGAGLPSWLMLENLPAMQETQVASWLGNIPWRKEWLPTPVFLPGESHGQRSLVGYSPWGRKEWERQSIHACMLGTYMLTSENSLLVLILLSLYIDLLYLPLRPLLWSLFCLIRVL